jgi:hypothetical protein
MIYDKSSAQQRRINRQKKYIEKTLELLQEAGTGGLEVGEIAQKLNYSLNRLGNYLSVFVNNNPEILTKSVSKKAGRWLSCYTYIGNENAMLNTNDCNLNIGEEI